MRLISVKELVELLPWRWALVLLVGICLLTADDVGRLLDARSSVGTSNLTVSALLGGVAALVCLVIVRLAYVSQVRGRSVTVGIAVALVGLLIAFRASHPRFGGDDLERDIQVVLMVFVDVFLICLLASMTIAGRRRDHRHREELAAQDLVAEE